MSASALGREHARLRATIFSSSSKVTVAGGCAHAETAKRRG